MNTIKVLQRPNGQALSEMIVSIPLLFLLAAAMIQFTLLFLSYVQFEHACGEAARKYAAGVIGKKDLRPQITRELGTQSRYFDIDSLSVTTEAPASVTASVSEKTRNAMGNIPIVHWGFNYDGAKWKVRVQFKPRSFSNSSSLKAYLSALPCRSIGTLHESHQKIQVVLDDDRFLVFFERGQRLGAYLLALTSQFYPYRRILRDGQRDDGEQ